ncbi:hypothetical protein FRACYDRAFT_245186 [Fragilariopsis cylindrus CCMP1102]|uniref:PiggyBac transposable element-derived protein domain-containing protein n=1 Tax=Fragilariopsis cylindrus CCMP1102 TaxID=635003 RepID=A0A1E7F004_9STRA|nr:hypothetical protein FRACYDRAFT_245186 [Fragilariopsis cylindrus CCMP1102]|eukprot:OEU11447.1 hypothetical protein FRACYDRAFT_245186 [Fragilariopsis cylindrus CCMP1102]
MAPRSARISLEWAKSLVGLSMKVPDYWWDGCKGYRLNDGVIDSYDSVEQKWNLLLNSRDDNDRYLMNYTAVSTYADSDSSTIDEYQLPFAEIYDGDDIIDANNGVRYFRTPPSEWSKVELEDGVNEGGRTIDPIEWTGEKEEPVNITDEEIESLRDSDGEIRFEKVFEWILPRFGDDKDQSLFTWQAARMRNYMRKKVVEDGWKPKYYQGDDTIQPNHVARFYGSLLAKMLTGSRSINQMFCTREIFNAVPPIQESMPKNALEDMTSCLHYSDDWDPMGDGDWDDTYDDPKVVAPPHTARHRVKHGILEECYIQYCVNPSRWITTDESRIAGWYHSCMTIGPDPKPIRTGATLHTVCITQGPLSSYKLYARVYGGKDDQDMNVHHKHTVKRAKMVSLYDFMLESFKHKGHCVVMDSAYMSDAMAQIGRNHWGINMVGTCQSDRTGAGKLGKADVKAKEVVIGSHESLMYQHNTKPLLYTVWGDNNFVKTLSNFHSPVVVRGGMKRKKRNRSTKRRDREFTDVDCPLQQKDYCETYHLIDKGNGAEAKYDLSTESHLHGWSPKLAARYFNMNINNAYKIHCYLFKKHHPTKVVMPLKECIHNLTHSLLQRGDTMRKRGSGAPPKATKDISTSSSVDGRKVRSDSVRQPFTSPTTTVTGTPQTPVSGLDRRTLQYRQVAFKRRKEQQPGRSHMSIPVVVKNNTATSYCKYNKCPGKNTGAKRKRAYMSKYACEECGLEKGIDFWLCNSTKDVDGTLVVVDCHTAYHVQKKLYTAPSPVSTAESSIISELTE